MYAPQHSTNHLTFKAVLCANYTQVESMWVAARETSMVYLYTIKMKTIEEQERYD